MQSISGIGEDTGVAAITGLGAVTPIGIGHEAFWQGLMAGRCGAGTVHAFDTDGLPAKKAYEVPDFIPGPTLCGPQQGGLSRGTQFTLTAACEALEVAGLSLPHLDTGRVGLCLGTIGGELQVFEEINRRVYRQQDVPPEFFEQISYDTMAVQVARHLGIRGPMAVIPTACAAGNYALAMALGMIRSGDVDVVIAGGADPLSHIIMTGFCRLNAVAPEVCRPFDLNRKGLMVGEGAGILILEPVSRARRRGAHIYALLAGFGLSCDAHHITGMDPEGRGQALAIERAMAQARLTPTDVDYICAHGTGTITNDRVETLAIKRIFGQRARKIPLSSIKSMIGHAMGAASAIEAVACALVIDRGAVPPTINFNTPDPECDLDIIPNIARALNASVVLNNAAAFGGNNSCVVFRSVR
jgi:3-oxoacyl-[acyl-carrier-protein] synthase II